MSVDGTALDVAPRSARNRWWGATANLDLTSADGAPPRPCSSQVYQVGLMLARCATSSRRSPVTRRLAP